MASDWDIAKWKREFTDRAEKGMEDVAREAEREAVLTISGKRGEDLAAVKDGFARASIRGVPDKLRAFLIGGIEYFVFIELGTEKMRARPILRTVVRKNAAKFVRILQRALDG
jgi:hypothetical protein